MADSKGQTGFEELGIAGVLKRYRLEVPPNQREYSWTEKQVSKLFQDLMWAVSDEQTGFYFLGTIVTIPRTNDLLEVVDGQQRLATTAILLSEIRYYLKDREILIAESINPFLTDIDREKRERVAKLTLNLDDNEFFRVMIGCEKDADRPKASHSSHALIIEAFTLARKHVKQIVAGYDLKTHGDVLNRWIEFLEHNAQIILLKVPTEANAYKMFETLNDRGLKTSQADLVKNYLFGQSGKRLPEAQQHWARMRSILETLEEDDITVTYLRQSMIAIRGHLREDDVFEAVQERAKGPQTSIQFLASLEALASAYVAIFNPDHEKWNPYPDSIRRAIHTLNLLNIRSMRPLLLATADKFPKKEAAEAFRMFISWGVRLIVASSTSRGSVEEPLAGAAHSVYKGDIADAAKLKKELAKIIPTDEEFKRAFENATVSKAAFARYYLRSLEMAAKNESTPWFIPNDDQQTINLEHVLPDQPEGNWPQFDEETAKMYVRRIGNLALLLAKSNSDLKSLGFDAKKKIYKETPYELTRQMGGLAQWGPKEISERQKVLAGLALKAWPL
ncbi:MAG TPA: DUF262 domain-containing HNH endonuclease family protein [Bryobacteraceae bacterium]|nr:DUF262 domain-containing HNH endonuclease family protein [Bryobacteraceae bacterium]